MDQNNRGGLVVLGLLLALGLLGAAGIGSYAFYKVKSFEDTLSVTGSARQRVTSDSVKWTSSFSRDVAGDGLKAGYAAMRADGAKVLSFLRDNGIRAEAVTIQPVQLEEPFKYNLGVPQKYSMRQSVLVQSNDVAKVTAVAKDVQKLMDQDIVFSTSNLEYSYSKLPELRVSLLSDAVKDAQDRAQKIAGSTNRNVGTLRSASMGVVQVLPVGSVEVSDYGAYDTSGIEKEVMVTVRTAFSLR